MTDFSGLLPDVPGREIAPLQGGADRALLLGGRRRSARRQRAVVAVVSAVVAAVVATSLDGGQGASRLEFIGGPHPRPVASIPVPGASRTATPQPPATPSARTSPVRAVAPPGTVRPSGGSLAVPPKDVAVREVVPRTQDCVLSWCTYSTGPRSASAGPVPIAFDVCHPNLRRPVESGDDPYVISFESGREVDVVVWRDADEDGKVDPATGPVWTWGREATFSPWPHDVRVERDTCLRWTVSWDLVEDGGRRAQGGYLVTVRVAIPRSAENTRRDPQQAYQLDPLVVGDGEGAGQRCLPGCLPPADLDPGRYVVEAEAGAIDSPVCGDDGPMRVLDNTDASGGKLVFHPGARCSQTFGAAGPLRRVDRIRYYTTGGDIRQCGWFTFSGGLVGTTPLVCTSGSEFVTVPVSTTGLVGPYTVTWVTAPGTPAFVNAFVDMHTGH